MIVLSKSKLKEILDKYGISTLDWGRGESKTINHLFLEIIRGETKLTPYKGSLLREVSALSIVVKYGDLKLREDYQEFNDGRRRRRKMRASVAEKLDINDRDLISAVKRAISEELDIKINDNQIIKLNDDIKMRMSMSYPNLLSKVSLFGFEVELNESQFDPNGYIEIQEDKKTYFKWENIT
jgi:hypothetical protein